MSETTKNIIAGILFALGIYAGWRISAKTRGVILMEAKPIDCSYYAERTINNIPVKCLKYFGVNSTNYRE